MVYMFSVEGGPLMFAFEVEADSRAEALGIARRALEGYLDVVLVVTGNDARLRLRSVCLRCKTAELSDESIVDERAGVTSC